MDTVELDKETLRRLQLTELDLLREADRICRKYGIRYCIIAGTMLGAVRHSGFIPWDDDVDIAMLRPEYERFCTVLADELDPQRYEFQDHRHTPGYRWGYGKLRRKDSVFLREHQEHMPYDQGVFMDVFPLDAVPESHFGRTVWNFRCFVIRKLLWSRVGRIADRSPVKRIVYALVDRIPEEKVIRWYERMIRRAGRISSDWVRILMFPTPNRQWGYLKEWYENSEPIRFEGNEFPGVRDYDAYLSFKFGDYLQLPPEEKRKTHPVSRIVLPKEISR